MYNVDIFIDFDLYVLWCVYDVSGVFVILVVWDWKILCYFFFDEEGLFSGWKNVNIGVEKISRVVFFIIVLAFSGI